MEILIGAAVPIVTAIIAAGGFNYLFRWLNNRSVNVEHKNAAWEQFKDKTLKKISDDNRTLEEKVDLLEIRHEKRDELFMVLMDHFEDLGATRDNIQYYRNTLSRIRYAKTIDELRAIDLS